MTGTAIVRPLGEPGDLGWVVMAHGQIYAQQFGWDASFEALVAGIVADYAVRDQPGVAAAWIAEAGGQRAGSIFCVPADDGRTARLRLLLMLPAGRGLGLGTGLVRTCVEFARAAGYQRMELWTNDVLAAARRIYLAEGFRLTSEEPQRNFGADLVSQTYALDLSPAEKTVG
jgi:GNAT superfamily N-acetyltransferase